MDLLFSGNFREMLIIFGLMLVLLQTGSCVHRICSFNQTEACYAALGDKLSLRMIQDINISRLELMKEESFICRIHNEKIMKSGLYSNRSDVIISNGTMVINNVTRADSGNYTLHLYDLQSKRTPTGLQVNVEAPIGSVKVSVECIRRVRWASCSSEGDSLFFNWTLNGQPLAQGNKTTINLDGETSGNLTCSVKNHISHGEKSITVNYCTGVDQICCFNQTETCYAGLGQKLSLQMILVPYKLKMKKDSLICNIKNDTKGYCDLYSNRPDVTISNGTVIVNNVTRADSGRYTLNITDSQGKKTSTRLQVNVEAPIGSVKVSGECISGVRWAYCSSEGDSLFFNWTLNGQPLAQENKTTINLDGKTSGNLTCSVKNHISHGEKSITVNYCTGTTPTAITTATTSSVTSDVTPMLTNNKQTSESGEETTTTATTTASVTSHLTSTLTNNKQTSDSGQVSVTFVIVWTLQMIFLLILLGGFHIYIRKRTSTQTPEEKQQEDIVLYENWNNIRH